MYDYAQMAKMKAHDRKLVARSAGPRDNPNGNGCGCTMANGGACGVDGPCGCPASPTIQCQGSIVQGNAIAKVLDSGTISIVLKDCREPVFITCPSHQFFQIDADTGLVFFYNFATCAFSATPSPGSCPSSYAQPFAVQDEGGIFQTFVCLPDGTYRITQGATGQAPTFTRVDCAPANCKRYEVKWEGTTFVITGPLTLSDLDVALAICNPA